MGGATNKCVRAWENEPQEWEGGQFWRIMQPRNKIFNCKEIRQKVKPTCKYKLLSSTILKKKAAQKQNFQLKMPGSVSRRLMIKNQNKNTQHYCFSNRKPESSLNRSQLQEKQGKTAKEIWDQAIETCPNNTSIW